MPPTDHHELAPNRVIVGDALAELQRLPAGTVDMVLTSPPYFRLRDYRVPGQLGLEGHVDEWVLALRGVARELVRLLTPTGSFWFNVADTYAARPRDGALRRSLLLGPERLLLGLAQDGWIVRNKIIWAKTNPMPSPVRSRFSTTYELLYLLTRSEHSFFDLDAVRIPHRSHAAARRTSPPPDRRSAWRGPNAVGDHGLHALKAAGIPGHPLGKNPGDVWPLATSSYHGPHPATFPLALAERAIRAGCPRRVCISCSQPWRTLRSVPPGAPEDQPGCGCAAGTRPGVVLDPFIGAGTTALAASRLGRDWLGVELNPTFAAAAQERLDHARARPP